MRSWPTPVAQSFSQQSFPEVRVPHWEGTAHSRPCQPAPTAAQKPTLSSWTLAFFLPHNMHKSWQLHRSLQDIVEQNKLAKKQLLLATPYLPLALYLLSSCLEISSYYFTTKNAHYISNLSCTPNIYLATTYPDNLRYLSRTEDILDQANLEDILFCLYLFDCTVKILDKSPLANIYHIFN